VELCRRSLDCEWSGVYWRVSRGQPFIYGTSEGWISEKKGIYHPLPSHEMIQIQTGSEAYLAPVVIPFEMDGL
jgi:hypothetical protein